MDKKVIWASADPGKHELKYAGLDADRGIIKGSLRSKYSPDTLRNDYFDGNSIIIQIDGREEYRLGESALKEPEAVTVKAFAEKLQRSWAESRDRTRRLA